MSFFYAGVFQNILKPKFSLQCTYPRFYWYKKGYTHPDTEPGIVQYRLRQVPSSGKLTLFERLKEKGLNSHDNEQIDIGLYVARIKEDTSMSSKFRLKKDPLLEEKARKRTLVIPLEEIEEDIKANHSIYGAHIHRIAEHYGIFEDLFGAPHYFIPSIPLTVQYPLPTDPEIVSPVYFGNRLTPTMTQAVPEVGLEEDGLWTLVMTCPDEHLMDNSKEYIHLMITNFSKDSPGDTIVSYLPPIPPRGTGFHRYIFLLFKQDQGRIDLSSESRKDSLDLSSRTFSTLDFYRNHQDTLTPGGLAFFQSEWDPQVRTTFRDILDMPEPSFEFVWPSVHRPQQQQFPGEQPFDRYLDQYRDIKDINEQVLKDRLKNVNPFRADPPPPKYPGAVPLPSDMPSWLKEREREKRLNQGIWRGTP